jgi:ribonuclease P protein component
VLLLLHAAHAVVCVLACDKTQEALTLPRRYRLSRRVGFSRLLHKKAQVKSWFAVYSEANQSGHARLGITVSKRIVPAASQRNVAKRLIRECFRLCAHNGSAFDIVVRLRKTLEKRDHPVAREALNEMLKTVLASK